MVCHNRHFPGLLLKHLLFISVLLVIFAFISAHTAEAGDVCPTQAFVSAMRKPDSYQNGTVQIQLFTRESMAKPLTLVVCLIKAGSYCYPKSVELADFLNYIRMQVFQDSRTTSIDDDEDLFYDEPNPDAHEVAMDLELQRQLLESSDALRSVFCVTRNCDQSTHLCSSDVLPEYVWSYHNFNRIRTDIKARRGDASQGKTRGKNSMKSGGQRMQTYFGFLLTSISSILTSAFVLKSYSNSDF